MPDGQASRDGSASDDSALNTTGRAGPGTGSRERKALQLLGEAHDRLAARAAELSPSGATRGSFCTDWSVAQVFSHLGSGAQIGALALEAARTGAPPPDPWPVWNVWDAKPPLTMVADFAPSDRAYLDALDEVVPEVEGGHQLLIPIDGRPWPLALALTARLVEMALHEWDIAVAGDSTAEVDPAAAAFVLQAFPLQVAAQGAAASVVQGLAPLTAEVEVRDPTDLLHLDLLTSGARLSRQTPPAEEEPDALLTLPDAAAWMRLVSGRWRPRVDDERARLTGDLTFADLWQLFPGF
ncbi:maleylpyruvate isomerase N-terminal domain-containing protein [Pedococcus sp. NPDC057267]|uniref:maleylpyruvate isomerase N-terminal domain-containing protein n=1 Tax=Pedococcus sp. NPDC057267 TaxID=3346077 RepID=UPI00362BA7B8